ncbi:hypothetical protein LY90DRAFT_234891 [Neocallimastix californiae]|uniref:Uncharacterized protein n=1 Tax=Neocallimastix californiae TaxID=1754190 RepID=A0A1Y1YJQ6_9FUNG|nr:hypothetical protein LY90DRAFT_234891 [Neocallimastix californiae]|eukprot:ORX98251.1 hypothetical protein LY90DRAFT_234891 [Neocallimastix californiae]
MSEDDIDGIYENMVKEVGHKKKNNNGSNDTINSDSKNSNSDNKNCNSNSNTNSTVKLKNKDKDRDRDRDRDKYKETTVITPLKSNKDMNEKSSSPKSGVGVVIPTSQNNKDDPSWKSFKALGNDNQRSDSYNIISSPRLEEKNLAIDVEEDNIYVIINPYGIRDIDYSTRRVLPVTKKENCSEDVDALFNLENQDRYQESVNKLNEIESTYNQCKNNSRVAVNDPDQPNDIDDLFIFSSDIEKKMTVFDSYIVVDDIQENIRPDIEDVLNIADNEEEEYQHDVNSNNKSSDASTPNSIGSPKSIMRRISKAFSSSRIANSNSKIIESTPINGEEVTNSNNHTLNRALTPKNLLIIPSYNENSTFEGGASEEERRHICCQSNSFDEFRKSQSSIFNRNKTKSSDLNQGDLTSKSQKEVKSFDDRLNTINTTKNLKEHIFNL